MIHEPIEYAGIVTAQKDEQEIVKRIEILEKTPSRSYFDTSYK